MSASKWLFLWMLLFSFYNVSDIWRDSISASPLLLLIAFLFIGCFLLEAVALRQGLEDPAVHLHQPLPLFSWVFCPWPTLNLHLSHLTTEYLFIFPLLILILKMYLWYRSPGSGFLFSIIEKFLSQNLKVLSFTLTSELTCCWCMRIFALTGSL